MHENGRREQETRSNVNPRDGKTARAVPAPSMLFRMNGRVMQGAEMIQILLLQECRTRTMLVVKRPAAPPTRAIRFRRTAQVDLPGNCDS
jgi:hypothetical protein